MTDAYTPEEIEAMLPSEPPPENTDTVSEGGRNSWLTRCAGALRKAGASEDTIHDALQVANTAQCEPPLEDREVAGIAKSVSRYEAGELPTQAPPRLRKVSVVEAMEAALKPLRFVIDGLLPRGVTSVLNGDGGVGKTIVAATQAAHVCAGKSFAGLDVEQGRVAFVSLEDPVSIIAARFVAICDRYGLDESQVWDNLTLIDGTDDFAPLAQLNSDNANAQLVFTQAYADLEEILEGGNFQLVIIDNASEAFDANEIVRRQVRAFMSRLTRLARHHDAAILLLAHNSKAGDISGSTGWNNSARSRYMLASVKMRLLLIHAKANYSARLPDIVVTIGAEGVPFFTGGEDAELIDPNDKHALLKCVHKAIARGITVPGRIDHGNGSAFITLSKLPEFPEHLKTGEGKKLVPAILQAVLDDGALGLEEYHCDKAKRRKEKLVQLRVEASSSAQITRK